MGKTARKVEENFLGITALPSWLTVTGVGTPVSTIVTPDQSSGGVRLTTSSAVNDATYLNMFASTGIGMQFLKEIIFDLEGFVFGSINSTFRFYMKNAAATKGLVIIDDSSQLKVIASHAVNGDTTVNANQKFVGDNQFSKKRNMRIRVQIDGTVAISEGGDDYFFVKKFEANQLDISDILLPKVGIVVRNPGTLTMRIPRVAVTLVHN
jgi:hypothetical protein